jgi:hypothetical protein
MTAREQITSEIRFFLSIFPGGNRSSLVWLVVLPLIALSLDHLCYNVLLAYRSGNMAIWQSAARCSLWIS